MSEPFVAEIDIVGFNFAPVGYAFCDGQTLPISQNTALFSLLGTTYGGNGTSNFQLPNLQGMAPIGSGQGAGLSLRELGETAGETDVTLLTTTMPAHSHQVLAEAGSGDSTDPVGNTFAEAKKQKFATDLYGTTGSGTDLQVETAGGNQPHNNMPPYLVLNFIIALQGVYPARS
jgi:microcystin-dependent protein